MGLLHAEEVIPLLLSCTPCSFHFPGTGTAIPPLLPIGFLFYFLFLSSRTRCQASPIITLSTSIEKSDRNLLHLKNLSQCQPAGGWRIFLLVPVGSCLAAPRSFNSGGFCNVVGIETALGSNQQGHRGKVPAAEWIKKSRLFHEFTSWVGFLLKQHTEMAFLWWVRYMELWDIHSSLYLQQSFFLASFWDHFLLK